ncbi:hypothetical protein BH10PSE17_BH10PSE17_02300 [soil metagenome]
MHAYGHLRTLASLGRTRANAESPVALQRLSIRARLLLLVLAVWLPAAAGFGLLARSVYMREEESARQSLQQLGQSMTFAVLREVDQRIVMARTLAATNALQDNDHLRFHAVASRAIAGTRDWVTLNDGTLRLIDTRKPADAPSVPRRIDAPPLLSGPPRAFFLPKSAGNPSAVIAVFAAPPGKDVAHVNVGVAFDPEVIQAVLRRYALPAGANAAVFDQNHLIIARTRDPELWVGKPVSDAMRRRLEQNFEGFADMTTLDGVRSLAYITSDDDHHWGFSIALPEATLSATARRVTWQAAGAAMLLLIIGLAAAAFAARRISGPILALRDAAIELGHDRVPPLLATGVAETDEVSRSLHEAGRRSQEATALLEQRVADAVAVAEVAQERLFQSQKHEVIGRLTGGIAHDFNNLLQTISMGLHMLGKSAEEGRQKRVAQAATQACAKAAELVKQMLTFGRSQPMKPQQVIVEDFVLRIRELAGKAVGERIRLEVDIAAGMPAVFVDAIQLELALLNLIFNARDAMPDGGSIRVIGRPAVSADRAPGLDPNLDYACLEVVDDGNGMDSETLAHALEPYFTTKRIGSGTGLGLAQVDAFAQQSNGLVQIRSARDNGTRVTLVLPAHVASESSQALARSADRPLRHRPLKVLMVEDDSLVSSVVAPALEALGHAVRLCENADAALHVLDEAVGFDVLFTDIVMPGKLSGLDLAHWCRRNRPSMPILVTTGYTAEEPDQTLRVIRKPYSIESVAESLQAVTEVAPSKAHAVAQSSTP